ncbi:ankyrin repeat domain-containing protein [Formicincola oecophyllae]|uniref:Ankyrin repeat domain-containing protein n=1 Tax=Formicincola oecophyllae TaxID=2558361 RepID=A0A4Y6UA87_9PROT|nr:ankyrin repeat domain-containing protein [Formicincola oecophyllae]QDH13376.1 ankyrin repeat domain-containing protein [Formicincola oecophyllae]
MADAANTPQAAQHGRLSTTWNRWTAAFTLAVVLVAGIAACVYGLAWQHHQGANHPHKLSAAEVQRKLDMMFSRADKGPPPKVPALARLGVSEERLETIWLDAARAGDQDIITGLLKRGMAPNVANGRGHTALILATYYDHLATVKALVSHGASPCQEDRKGNTALMGAAFRGNEAILRYLAAQGCDVNHRNHAGQTALMMAALFGRAKAAKALLALGAERSLKDQASQDALSLARLQGNGAMVELLSVP